MVRTFVYSLLPVTDDVNRLLHVSPPTEGADNDFRIDLTGRTGSITAFTEESLAHACAPSGTTNEHRDNENRLSGDGDLAGHWNTEEPPGRLLFTQL